MPVTMMQIREVRVVVRKRCMRVPMSMRFTGRVICCVSMLVMFVVEMFVLMRLRVVRMLVLVTLNKVQPKTNAH